MSDLQVAQDGDTYHIDEVTGTPGLDLIADFVDVTKFDYVQVIANYRGSASHTVSIQLYNWARAEWHTWSSCVGIEITKVNRSYWVPCPVNYIGTGADAGKVRLRCVHTMGGNASHDFYIDVLALYNREVDLDALEDKLNHHWGPWR